MNLGCLNFLLSRFLKKNLQRIPVMPTAGMWGAVGTLGLVWATDWRLILDWVPYINGKFKKDD
uniref:Cytochrome b-c1 complex subunit 10 n=1 Tax=Ursus maritimus TaxID=29073 RepID=A0A452TI29_URSMA